MRKSRLDLYEYQIQCYSVNTLVIGSGAAALNAAVSLHSLGQDDIMIVTSGWGEGTSNNAGSDKQTYYKLSLSGREPDSVQRMAGDLFGGKCMHGDIALCEAQGSVRAFMNLVNLGVPFPHDKFGSWVGYKTDHDPRARATSAGPYTSQMMFKVLASEVKKRNIEVLDQHHVVALLTGADRSSVVGALAINTNRNDPEGSFVLFNTTNIILGTGGPGDIYEDSVYPVSQTGSDGMAFAAGATGQNLTETQFGIASTGFRWNLSGSYQQVIPRYFSKDNNSDIEHEFLNEHFPDYKSITGAIFLKGYQWPFDVEKIANHGSSLIDVLVYREKKEKDRKVFIDYRRNLTWNGDGEFHPDKLDDTVRNYLEKSGSLQESPVKRLMAINAPAFRLFRDHGIDLEAEPVEVAVCAQHSNGGLKGNIWWESDLKHLFPVGEINGSHGVKRPGGSALNAGQVGSFRAAQFISAKYREEPPAEDKFLADAYADIKEKLEMAKKWLSRGKRNDTREIINEIRKRMSACAAIIRNAEDTAEAAAEAESLFESLPERLGASNVHNLKECFIAYDNCLSHLLWLKAINTYIRKGGRSRGSYIVTSTKGTWPGNLAGGKTLTGLCRYNRKVEKGILEINYRGGKAVTRIADVRGIPGQDLWFEIVWREYLEDNSIRY